VTTGIVIFAHGSSIESANESVRRLVESMGRNGGSPRLIEAAFLEQGRPDLAEAVAALARKEVKRIIVVPYFLTLGLHLQRDLPKIVAGLSRIHKDVDIRVAPPLEGHPALCEILEERAMQTLAGDDED